MYICIYIYTHIYLPLTAAHKMPGVPCPLSLYARLAYNPLPPWGLRCVGVMVNKCVLYSGFVIIYYFLFLLLISLWFSVA